MVAGGLVLKAKECLINGKRSNRTIRTESFRTIDKNILGAEGMAGGTIEEMTGEVMGGMTGTTIGIGTGVALVTITASMTNAEVRLPAIVPAVVQWRVKGCRSGTRTKWVVSETRAHGQTRLIAVPGGKTGILGMMHPPKSSGVKEMAKMVNLPTTAGRLEILAMLHLLESAGKTNLLLEAAGKSTMEGSKTDGKRATRKRTKRVEGGKKVGAEVSVDGTKAKGRQKETTEGK